MRVSATRWARRTLAGWCLLSLFACTRDPSRSDGKSSTSPSASNDSSQRASEAILPLRMGPPENERLVALGSRLFHDPLLSGDGTVSCSSCHDLANGGDDGLARSRGVGGKLGVINAPTVLNAALNPVQFWDGRARTLEDQIDGPIEHPLEMGSDWATVERKLAANAEYAGLFTDALGAVPSRQGVKQAIAAFERTLITIESPFDLWVDGDSGALTAEQREGYELFKSAGCVACHQGQNAGGNMYQSFGVFGNYFEDRGNVTDVDYGRYNVTKLESDRFVFRVPTLRNVELTAPYFHDGSATTLTDAVKVMVRYQLGKELADDQVAKLVEFLKSLTGRPRKILASRERGTPT